ncbi:MAG TPA: endonuclease/exonuclease/phosphatase family protein [Solirubrobacterales bacterium]
MADLAAAAGARRYWWIWAAVLPIVLWTVIRLFGLERGYPLVPILAFTPYAAVVALLVAGIALALRNWAAAVVAGLAAFCLAAAVLPRAIGDETAPAAGHETLSVLAANIHHGTADPDALIALVDRLHPDLLSIEELTPGFVRKLRAAGIEERLPNAIVSIPRFGPYAAGTGLFTSLPMRKLKEGPQLIFRLPRASLELADGRRVRVVGVHTFPPQEHMVGEWKASLESLPSAGSGPPWVLAGDFNATLDHAELRDVLARGYRDAAEVAGKGLEPTWPQGWDVPPFITIDHVLADDRLGIVEFSVEDLPGSDHHAVHAVLALPDRR